jgi:hypothetical protein
MGAGRALLSISALLIAILAREPSASAQSSDPVPVSPAAHAAATPDIAVNPRGEVAVLWVDQRPDQDTAAAGRDERLSYVDLYVATSRDGDGHFSAPVRVNHAAGLVRALAVNRPRILGTGSGTWHVSFAANEIHPTLDKPMLTTHYTRSVDGGASFAPSRRLSNLADVDLSQTVHIHGGYMSASAFGTMAVTPDGMLRVLWIDSRTMTPASDVRALYMVTSRDDGATFSTENQLIATGVCPCCQMMAATDGASNLYFSLRMVDSDGTRQASIGRIAAETDALSAPVDTGGARWRIDGCPLKPAVIAVAGKRVFTAVYNGAETKPGVYLSLSRDGGRSYGQPMAVHPDASVSDAPAIAMNDRVVLVAWHGKTDGPRRVFYRMYDLDGIALGPVQALPSGAEAAQNPVVATRSDGQFQLAWQQADQIFTAVLPSAPGRSSAMSE